MSPRSADPALRTALVEAAARVLAREGPHALTTRRLAAEVGTSTMAVYTRFGSMDEVRRAVRREGFARLVADLDATPATDDPVADLVASDATYLANGLSNPHLYQAMFIDRPLDGDDQAGAEIFQRLVDGVRRSIEAGRFHEAESSMSLGWAAQLWTMRHGMVTLALTGVLPAGQTRVLLADMAFRLFVGYGDDPAAAKRSVDRGMPGHQRASTSSSRRAISASHRSRPATTAPVTSSSFEPK